MNKHLTRTYDEDEVFLTREQFKAEFVYEKEYEVDAAMRDGLPHEFIDGRLMFPRKACHDWYAGVGK